jgi:hypothetical protein
VKFIYCCYLHQFLPSSCCLPETLPSQSHPQPKRWLGDRSSTLGLQSAGPAAPQAISPGKTREPNRGLTCRKAEDGESA